MSAVTDMQPVTTGDSQQTAKRRYNYRVKTGAPTAYRKAYAHMLVDFCAKGYSLTAFAGHIRVSRACLNRWGEQYPEFKEALQIAKAARAECLEREAMESENSAFIGFRLKALPNCAPDDWRDTQSIEINQNINVAFTIAQTLDSLSTKVIEGVLHDGVVTQSNEYSGLELEDRAILAEGSTPVAEPPAPASILGPVLDNSPPLSIPEIPKKNTKK